MSVYLTDANCLLSFFTDRVPRQHELMSGMIARAARTEVRLTIIPQVLSELVYVLTRIYQMPAGHVADLVDETLDSPGIGFLEVHPVHRLLELWPDSVSDYGDAALAAAAQETGTSVLTFDKAFARQLKRLEIPHASP